MSHASADTVSVAMCVGTELVSEGFRQHLLRRRDTSVIQCQRYVYCVWVKQPELLQQVLLRWGYISLIPYCNAKQHDNVPFFSQWKSIKLELIKVH